MKEILEFLDLDQRKFIENISVDQGSTLVILETPIYLMEGDALEGEASAASTLDLYISYEVISQ